MFLVFRAERVAKITSYPIKFQQDLKKIGDISSSPRANNGFICFKACSTSFAVNFWIKFEFMLGVTFFSIPWRIGSKSVGYAKVKSLVK